MEEPQPNNTLAIVALVVSISSAVLTFAGLGWQLVLYRLQGARLKVELKFRFRDHIGKTVTVDPGQKHLEWGQITAFQNMSDLGIEYAFVRLTNIGRTAVSVENIGLDIGRYKLVGKGRRTVTPQQFQEPDSDPPKDLLDLGSPHRLDPGDNISVGLHIWPALADPDIRRHRGSKPLIVRATATAVGRDPTRSARRHSWKVPAGVHSLLKNYLPSKQVFVYRSLWDGGYQKDNGKSPRYWHGEIMKLLDGGADVERLLQFFEEKDKEGLHHMTAYKAHKAYRETPTALPKNRSTLHRVLWGQTDGP